MFRSLLLLLLFMGLACKSQEKGKLADSEEGIKSPELTLLVADNYGGSEDADFRVIRDMKTLQHFFAQVNKTRKPGLPIPEVDFNNELVILHCPGKMMNGTTSNLIIKANRPDQLVFSLKEARADQNREKGALTMPFSLYKLPLTDKELVLQEE